MECFKLLFILCTEVAFLSILCPSMFWKSMWKKSLIFLEFWINLMVLENVALKRSVKTEYAVEDFEQVKDVNWIKVLLKKLNKF